MAADEVQRDLRLTTPLTEGPDVKALQRTLNKAARRLPRILDFELDEDEKFGEETLKATVKVAHVMGINRERLNEIEKKHLVVERVQRLLHDPGNRSDAQKRRAEERRKALRKALDRRLSLKNVDVTLSAGAPHWGGAGDVMTEFIEPFLLKRKLPIGSGKRTPAENHAVGGSESSDHLTTKTKTAARDFPTFTGEDDARALAKALGIDGWQPNSFTSFTFSAGGHSWRAQILWGAQIDHGDHVHVGVSPA
jgi:hypothetical protein